MVIVKEYHTRDMCSQSLKLVERKYMDNFYLIMWFISLVLCWIAFWNDWKNLSKFQKWALTFSLAMCLIAMSQTWLS
ncbi:hypothetical protein LP2241_50402 [Pseudolactococcus piscium]|nr:hypothetical protein LP2241_50402 [Lactococcus piscium]